MASFRDIRRRINVLTDQLAATGLIIPQTLPGVMFGADSENPSVIVTP